MTISLQYDKATIGNHWKWHQTVNVGVHLGLADTPGDSTEIPVLKHAASELLQGGISHPPVKAAGACTVRVGISTC